ncbi:MAG: PHP domain-containing protein [Planctomycetota bacterium]|jgi:hypothetical protein
MKPLRNPFTVSGNWYKANLHTHSANSDGALPPEKIVANYWRKGYAVLALTDHGTTNNIRRLSGKDMLVISGAEYHPAIPGRGDLFHLVALNVPHAFALTPAALKDARHAVAQITRAGGLTILAHPYWCGLEYADFKHLTNIAAVEVWNTICDCDAGRGCSENEWTYMLDRKWIVPAVAVDDTHSGGAPGGTDAFRGWTWLKMRAPTAANVLKAIRTGACYASTGPTIHDFHVADGKLTLKCSPVVSINFKAGPGTGERKVAPKGKTIRSFTMALPNYFRPYVRAVVTDAAGQRAWTNPIML